MSWILIAGLVFLYLIHAIVIQPWLTTIALNATQWVEKKITSLTASGTTIAKKL